MGASREMRGAEHTVGLVGLRVVRLRARHHRPGSAARCTATSSRRRMPGRARDRYRRRVDLASSRAARALRRVQSRPQLHDPLLATVFAVGGLAPTAAGTVGYRPADGLAVILVLAGTVPYALRRRAPLPVFLCSLAGLTALFVLGYDGGALPAVVAVGAYTVGAYRPLHEVLLGA